MINLQQAFEYNENMLKMDGFDDCILGICCRIGQQTILAYDFDKVINKLMKTGKMSREEAVEYYEFNQLGAYMGEHTPCFIERIKQ